MRMLVSVAAVCFAGALIGCGQSSTVESAVPPTSELHGGVLVPLTDKEAYAELKNGDAVKKGTAYEMSLIVYVLQPDQKTPVAETPTSVQVKIGTPKGEQLVALKAAPDSADPLGSTRFVSEPGPYELNQNGGEVTVQLGGKTLSGQFRGPR